jgi:hypothetical protein
MSALGMGVCVTLVLFWVVVLAFWLLSKRGF